MDNIKLNVIDIILLSNVEELISKLNSKSFSSKDASVLEEIVSSKRQQINDTQISIILNDAIEIIRICRLLLSKVELESSTSSVMIDSQQWRQLGSDRVYYKIDDFLKEMNMNKSISSLTYALGGTVFYTIVSRIEYIDFIHKEIKHLVRSISSIISPNESPGIQIAHNILERIDPSFSTLNKWIRGDNSKDFEKGVSILLTLSGFRTIHVGQEYETASLNARRTKYRLGKSNLDMIALSNDENHILLCQCTLGSIEQKTRDLMNITNEIRENIAGNDVQLHPIIITSVSNQQITSSLDNATNSGISVFTIEDLECMLKAINDSKSLSFGILNKLTKV